MMSGGVGMHALAAILVALSLIQPSLEDSLGFAACPGATASCHRLALRGSPSEPGLSACLSPRTRTRPKLDGLRTFVSHTSRDVEKAHTEPRLGSAHAIQKKHFNQPPEEEDQSPVARLTRAVKGVFDHNSPPTLLGSPSLRILHDEIVPDEDKLPNEGRSETLEALQGAVTEAVEVLQDPERAAEETGGWVLLGSRRVGWFVSKLQGLPGAIFGGGEEGEDGEETAPQKHSESSAAAVEAAAEPVEGGGEGGEEFAPLNRAVGNFREQTEVVNVGIKKIFQIASDVVHYPEWCGTGIKSVKILREQGDYTEACYKAGAFGYMFDFVLAFQKQAYDKVTFRMLEGGSIQRLEGEYRFEEQGEDACKVHFALCAELAGFIPGFVQNSIGNMIMAIAVGELAKYCESARSAHITV